MIYVDIVSDTICPWCYIGKRRFERALEQSGRADIAVAWRPFQLNPDMPPEGMTREDYVRAKFGGGDRPRQIYQAIAESGREAGIEFKFSLIRRTPNTVLSHRLVHWAGKNDRQDEVVGELPLRHDAGLFEGLIKGKPVWLGYRLRASNAGGSWELEDPYRFGPVLDELDDYLMREGTHRRLWEKLGAHAIEHEGVSGVHFAVWAPNASRVSVVGDFNDWDGRRSVMRTRPKLTRGISKRLKLLRRARPPETSAMLPAPRGVLWSEPISSQSVSL